MYTFFFFFNDTATTEIYTLSLHDALPICRVEEVEPLAPLPQIPGDRLGVEPARLVDRAPGRDVARPGERPVEDRQQRSEEHTSELQSRQYLVCRLLLEKKKKKRYNNT